MSRYSILLITAAIAASATQPAMAQKEKFERNKPHVNVGTIGHVDHDRNKALQLKLKIRKLSQPAKLDCYDNCSKKPRRKKK